MAKQQHNDSGGEANKMAAALFAKSADYCVFILVFSEFYFQESGVCLVFRQIVFD